MPPTWLQKPKSVKPYSQLAYIYDYVMRHVSYSNWALYLEKLFQKADVKVHRVLDISCGTGSLLFKIQDLNYCVAGMDSCKEMLHVAHRKARTRSRLLPLWVGSMDEFGVHKLFHAVICTYDSINYCMDDNTVVSTMQHVAHAMCSGGVFIFDICTEKNSTKNFQRYYETDETDKFRYSRISYYQRNRRIQMNKFLIKWKSDSSRSFLEIHRQQIFRLDEMKRLIPQESFQTVGIYDGFSLRPGSEKSNRVHFVLKKM